MSLPRAHQEGQPDRFEPATFRAQEVCCMQVAVGSCLTYTAKVLVTVPSRVLLEQFAEEFPTYCKVGMGYNNKIDYSADGFISVTDSVHRLENMSFEAIFIDEGHHPDPPGLPQATELYRFSATLQDKVH